tara:strand:- start:46 stop:231 length:186 start_codon:yes stop_codon:yes gene_type:complete
MPKIKVTLSIGYPTATHKDELEIDKDEWDHCETEEEREDLINDYWRDWSNNYIDGGAELIE